MNTAAPARTDDGTGGQAWATWLLPGLGLAAMYLPAYHAAAGSIWQTDEHAHGPIILAVVVWLLWSARRQLAALAPQPRARPGAALLLAGLLIYLMGRTLDSSVLVFGSQPLVAAGIVLLLTGVAGWRLVWFPLLYLIFMVPLPSLVVDSATGPLKQWVAEIAEAVLHGLGYPIARSGVVISVGQYQMLVADACSGLHSMVSLAALGTLFLYLVRRPGRLHNGLMLAAILPMAFAANIVRVLTLLLVTYHGGEEAGQGFLHGAAGVVLVVTALGIFFALDASLASVLSWRERRRRGSAT